MAGKHSNGGRIRWIVGVVAALIIIAVGTGTALALTGSPGSPPVREAAARHSDSDRGPHDQRDSVAALPQRREVSPSGTK